MDYNEKLNSTKEIVNLTRAREGIQVDIKNSRLQILLNKLRLVRKEYENVCL